MVMRTKPQSRTSTTNACFAVFGAVPLSTYCKGSMALLEFFSILLHAVPRIEFQDLDAMVASILSAAGGLLARSILKIAVFGICEKDVRRCALRRRNLGGVRLSVPKDCDYRARALSFD